jgi:hypothetical protein
LQRFPFLRPFLRRRLRRISEWVDAEIERTNERREAIEPLAALFDQIDAAASSPAEAAAMRAGVALIAQARAAGEEIPRHCDRCKRHPLHPDETLIFPDLETGTVRALCRGCVTGGEKPRVVDS